MPPKSVFPLDEALRRTWREAAVAAAETLGVFTAVTGAPTLAALAQALDVRAVGLAALVDALCAEEVLARDGERLSLPAPPVVTRDAHSEQLRALLVDGLRARAPLAAEDTGERFQAHLAQAATAVAPALWRTLGARGRLIDVGAGPGVYARAWVEAGGAAATAIDRAPVVARARDGGVVDWVVDDVVAGEGALPGAPADTVLLANVLHLLPGPLAARLVARAARSARRVVVYDLRCDDDRRGPPSALWFSMTMALYTDGGRVHSAADVAGFFAAAGLRPPVAHSLAEAPDAWALVGERSDD